MRETESALVFANGNALTESFNEAGDPVIVIAPLPPKFTIPVLEKDVPDNFNVVAEEGVKFNSPLLVTVPLLVKLPIMVWLEIPPMNTPPVPIVMDMVISQSWPGLIPAVLLIFRMEKVGVFVELKTGETLPLKFAMPVEGKIMVLVNWMQISINRRQTSP